RGSPPGPHATGKWSGLMSRHAPDLGLPPGASRTEVIDAARGDRTVEELRRLKAQLHHQLLAGMDLAAVGTMNKEELRQEVRRVDETSPMVASRLPDGSRLNAIIPPLALDGALVSIRRFGARPIQAKDLVTLKALTIEMLDFLAACVRARLNILVSGGTGSGKTTLLNALSAFIPEEERVIT